VEGLRIPAPPAAGVRPNDSFESFETFGSFGSFELLRDFRRGSRSAPCVESNVSNDSNVSNAYFAARSSLMMFCSASMISSLSTFDFLKLSRRSNALVGGLNANTKNFGRPGLGFAVS
jgi:hypothetical protein